MRKSSSIPPTYLADLFHRYMRFEGLTCADVAEKLGCSSSCIAYRLRRPDENWRVNEIADFCQALGCPMDLAIEAQTRGCGVTRER